MEAKIDIYNQIKAFYSIVFNSKHDIRPTHVSLYMFLLNQNNRNMWVEWFKCPFDLAMQGALITSKTTYYKILDDLVKFDLILYKKGINHFKAPSIKIKVLSVPKNDTVTGQVSVPLSVPLTGQLPVPLSGNIIRLITEHYILLNNSEDEFEKFIGALKKGKPEKKERKPNEWLQVYIDWYKKKCGVEPKITWGADIKALNDIESYLKNVVTDGEPLKAWQYVLDNVDKWGQFESTKLKLIQINSNLANIINNIKNGRVNGNKRAGADQAMDEYRQRVIADLHAAVNKGVTTEPTIPG